ncbi:MAG: hypothetical protein K2W95_33210 [Candidatus Obscuribacterales bacterium]|nr:hypothetical protein [Candidatus Obscuribacterales bacterium]
MRFPNDAYSNRDRHPVSVFTSLKDFSFGAKREPVAPVKPDNWDSAFFADFVNWFASVVLVICQSVAINTWRKILQLMLAMQVARSAAERHRSRLVRERQLKLLAKMRFRWDL